MNVVTFEKGPIPDSGLFQDASTNGFLVLKNWGSREQPNYNMKLKFTELEELTLKSFDHAKLIANNSIGDDSLISMLNKAIKLVGKVGENTILYRKVSNETSDDLEIISKQENGDWALSRLDLCECQDLLKCPEGTGTLSNGAASIDDCIATKQYVFERVSLIPRQNFSNITGQSLILDTFETGNFEIDLTELPGNMTYGIDYRFAIYKNCIPCSVRTFCSHISHNEMDENNELKDCCKCEAHPLTEYIETQDIIPGFPDNKHRNVNIDVSALSDLVEIEAYIELLNMRHASSFKKFFSQNDIFSHEIHRPTRFAHRKDNAQWLSVIKRDSFRSMKMDLPLNLPIWTGDANSEWSKFQDIIIDTPSRSQHTHGDLYDDDGRKIHTPALQYVESFENIYQDDSWWTPRRMKTTSTATNLDLTSIGLPYLPFFTSCDLSDSHLSISRLLEGNNNCTLVNKNETIPVGQIHLSGASPYGDTCSKATLQCNFEEKVDSASDNLRWFESQAESTLFYITKDAVDKNVFNPKLDTLDDEQSALSGISNEITEDRYLVPVKITKSFGGFKNVIPRDISLDLHYYQVDRGTKRLVTANLYFSNLCTTLRPIYFGGDDEVLQEMAQTGIFPCEVDVNGDLKSRGYNLEISLHPLDWFHLLNHFQFSGFIYFVYFTLAGLISLLVGKLLWILNKAMSKLRHPPAPHGLDLYRLLSESSFYGMTLSMTTFSIALTLAFAFFNPKRGWISESKADWYSATVPDNDLMTSIQNGRIGTILLVTSIFMSIKAIASVIRIKSEDIRVKSDIDDDFSLDSEDEKDDSLIPVTWKRAHYIVCCIFVEILLLCVWEWSYSDGNKEHLFQTALLSRFLFSLIEIFLSHLVKEKLLCAPILTLLHLTEVFTTLGSRDFVEFTLLFFIHIVTSVLHRIYIDPCFKSFMSLWPRWRFVLVRKLRPRIKMTVQQKHQEEKRWRKINEEIELRNEGVEPLIDAISLSSITITARVLIPLMLMILLKFESESSIGDRFNLTHSDLFYYILFAACMIPWSMAVDVLLFNAQELVHGWRLYDYLVYQRHRFGSRDHRWAINAPYYDESVNEKMQSIDLMSFSSQYYFFVSFLVGSMISTLLGATILLRTKQYNILSDPLLPLMIGGIALFLQIFERIVMFISSINIDYLDFTGIWGNVQIDGAVDDMIASKLKIGEDRQKDLDQERLELEALNNEQFRHRFVERNRPWIIRHLVELLTGAELSSQEKSKLLEFTRDIFTQIQAPRKNQVEISSDDEDEDDERRSWTTNTDNLPENAKQMMKTWYGKARRRILLLSALEGIDIRCISCNRECLESLETKFIRKHPEQQDNMLLWKSYVKACTNNTCDICRESQIETNSTHDSSPKEFIQTRACDISSESDSESENENFEALAVPTSTSLLLQKWLRGTRSSLGGNFPRQEGLEFTHRYLNRMKEKEKMHKEEKIKDMRNDDEEYSNDILPPKSKDILKRWLEAARRP